ncbi:hypothetical protein [Streptomyces sp. NPDC091259]|uniref:hypothetical protein n=1 Tax=Streptomyces sp. NPDC091259 TaxID=3365976 RepID=UPI0038223BC6
MTWFIDVATKAIVGVAVGRTVPLRAEAARLVAASITAADEDHPWTGMQFASAWGSRDALDVTLVCPELVAEISADTAVDHGGIYRHPVRFNRLRLDLRQHTSARAGSGVCRQDGIGP